MTISIVGRHIDVSGETRDYAEKRLEKLKKYFPHGPVDVHVVCFKQKFLDCCEVTMIGNGVTAHAEERSESLEASIDLVVDKLDAQLRKHKERIIKNKQKQLDHDRKLDLNISYFERDDIERSDGEPKVVHTKKLAFKPMSVDEAAMQMDLIGNEFLMFENAQSKRINVIYRMKDGDYGLIEPNE